MAAYRNSLYVLWRAGERPRPRPHPRSRRHMISIRETRSAAAAKPCRVHYVVLCRAQQSAAGGGKRTTDFVARWPRASEQRTGKMHLHLLLLQRHETKGTLVTEASVHQQCTEAKVAVMTVRSVKIVAV